jgi:hypothetical protein
VERNRSRKVRKMAAEQAPTIYQEITVRYGELWARVTPNGIRLGYGGGELADFPDLKTFEELHKLLHKAWEFLHGPQPTPARTPKPPEPQTPQLQKQEAQKP